MYGLNELKNKIKIEEDTVGCPVKNCLVTVQRQRQSFQKDTKYKCPIHKIYISPTTFEYETAQNNLLWIDKADNKLYTEILKFKRESRIARDNSEDALTWNVFRFLDKNNLIIPFLSKISNKKIKTAELILWSYSSNEQSNWSWLNKARLEFGETVAKGSEPDIIILTNDVLYFFEAKLTANNKTEPSNPQKKKKYETGGDEIFQQIFKEDYDTIARKKKRYELMRFWLLGNWIAKQLNLDFEFYSLVTEKKDKKIEIEFGLSIIQTEKRKFFRITWEEIFYFIDKTQNSKQKQIVINYFNNKTIGYRSGRLRKAFKI